MLVYTFDPYSNKGTIALSFICTGKQGRVMAKDMANIYRNFTTQDLKTLRSKKYVRLQKLTERYSWFDRREREMLVSTMKQIDAELASRFDQLQLF